MSGITGEFGSRTRRTTRLVVAAGLGAAIMVGTLSPPATAAKPNHRACLGHDIRTYARGGAEFGGFVARLAGDGVGTEIQAHLAGNVPDAVLPNRCND